jgi:hypothetical protein
MSLIDRLYHFAAKVQGVLRAIGSKQAAALQSLLLNITKPITNNQKNSIIYSLTNHLTHWCM